MKTKPKIDPVRALDGQYENWLWVSGVKKPYVCDTHDEYLHFCARAFEMGDQPRFALYRKAVA